MRTNKGRRNEITKSKYKKRLKIYGLKNGDYTALKSHSTPCSCGLCRAEKYRTRGRQKSKYVLRDELKMQIGEL